MEEARDFAPGCFRNLAPLLGESFLGFLMRLAEANGYAGVAELLSSTLTLLQPAIGRSPSRAALEIRSQPDLLSLVGRIAVGLPSSTSQYAIELLAEDALFIQGCRVDLDAWLGDYAQVCPQCLGKHGFARDSWDLAAVAVCSKHHAALLDICGDCGSRLDWRRASLMSCGECGSDLRAMTTEAVGFSDSAASEDFEALAPFRLRLSDGTDVVSLWDTAFRVLKSLALEIQHFKDEKWPERFFSQLPNSEKLSHLRQLSAVRSRGAYDLKLLRPTFLATLRFLNPVPKHGLAASCAFRILHSGAGLPRDVAGALTSAEAAMVTPSGAALFHGRPPSMRSRHEAEAFIGVDSTTFDGLRKQGLWAEPAWDGAGYDIDELLAAQAFLAHELLTLVDVERVVGVPLDWEDLRHSPLLTRWNPRSGPDLRVAVSAVCSLQLQLGVTCAHAPLPKRGVHLATLVASVERPFQAISALVALVISGGLASVKWDSPYTWSSLVVDGAEVASLARNPGSLLEGFGLAVSSEGIEARPA